MYTIINVEKLDKKKLEGFVEDLRSTGLNFDTEWKDDDCKQVSLSKKGSFFFKKVNKRAFIKTMKLSEEERNAFYKVIAKHEIYNEPMWPIILTCLVVFFIIKISLTKESSFTKYEDIMPFVIFFHATLITSIPLNAIANRVQNKALSIFSNVLLLVSAIGTFSIVSVVLIPIINGLMEDKLFEKLKKKKYIVTEPLDEK